MLVILGTMTSGLIPPEGGVPRALRNPGGEKTFSQGVGRAAKGLEGLGGAPGKAEGKNGRSLAAQNRS
jgi:hypothetical protein